MNNSKKELKKRPCSGIELHHFCPAIDISIDKIREGKKQGIGKELLEFVKDNYSDLRSVLPVVLEISLTEELSEKINDYLSEGFEGKQISKEVLSLMDTCLYDLFLPVTQYLQHKYCVYEWGSIISQDEIDVNAICVNIQYKRGKNG